MRRVSLPILILVALALGVVAAQQPQGPGQLRPRPGTGREPEFPAPKITDYKPKSTLVVPEHPVPRAKFPVVDVHTHTNDARGIGDRVDRRALESDRRLAPLLLAEGAGRRRRPDRAVELPVDDGDLEARARAGRPLRPRGRRGHPGRVRRQDRRRHGRSRPPGARQYRDAPRSRRRALARTRATRTGASSPTPRRAPRTCRLTPRRPGTSPTSCATRRAAIGRSAAARRSGTISASRR